MKKWLLLLLLLPGPAFGEEFAVKDLAGGVYTNPSSNRIPDNAATSIENFYTDVESIAIERNGFEKKDSTVLGGGSGSSVPGLWEFVDNTGQQWIISFSSKSYYKNLIGVTPAVFGSSPTIGTIPDCAVNLGKIWCVNGSDVLWWFDGVSSGSVASAPLGTLIEPWRNRLIIGNITGSQSTLRVSGDGDGTEWTVAGQSTSPFSMQIGGANDGFNTTCMWKSYLDNFVIGRKKDLWYLSGFDQSDFELRNVSAEIGCIQQGSMREFDGSLLFLSNRGMEELRGYTITHISEPIRNITDTIVKNTSSARIGGYTTEPDFTNGSISPTAYLSVTALSGSVVLTTANATSVVDTSSTEFKAGAVVNSTATNGGEVTLALTGNKIYASTTTFTQSGAIGCGWRIRPYLATETFVCDGVGAGISPTATAISNVATFRTYLLSDNANTPGNVLASVTTYGDNFTSGGRDDFGMPAMRWTTPVTLTANTTYWIKAQAVDCPGGGNMLNWQENAVAGQNLPNYTYTDSLGSTVTDTSLSLRFSVLGGLYTTSVGSFTSTAKDIGFTTNTWMWNWGKLQASTATPTNTTIAYQTRSSSDGTHWTPYSAASNDSLINPTVQRYVSYIATFSTTVNTVAPRIDSLSIFTSSLTRPSALYTSSAVNVGSLITAWGPLTLTDAPNSGTISYEFNSSTNSTTSLFISTSWASITSGGVPSSPVASYFAVRSSFSVTGGTQAPRLDAFSLQWAEGGINQPLNSWIYDRRYWLAFTTQTASASYNDRVLVYQRNRTWTMLTGINAASFAIWRDNLYFGNAIGNGYVYKFDVGSDDDGTSILSRITTKSYDLGAFRNNKDLESVYANFLGNSAFSGSFSLTYDLDRSGADYSLGSANMNEGTGEVAAKFPFPLSNPVQGREIQYKIVKNGTGDRLKLYELGTVFTLMEAQ